MKDANPPPQKPSVSDKAGPTRPSRARRVWRLVAGLLTVILLLGAGFVGVMTTETGSRLGLSLAQRVSPFPLVVDGWQGRLLDRWSARQFSLDLPGISIDLRGLDVTWRPRRLLQGLVDVEALAAQRVTIRTAPSGKKTSSGPLQSLALPMDVTVDSASISVLELASGGTHPKPPAEPYLTLRELHVQALRLAEVHSVERVSVQTPYGAATASARVGTRKPFDLSANVALDGRVQARAAKAHAKFGGSLTAMTVEGDIEGENVKGRVHLLLHPFESIPILEAAITAEGLDPSLFNAAAPHAKIDVQANLRPGLAPGGSAGQADTWIVSGPVRLRNRTPGALNDAALPVEQVDAQISWKAGELALAPFNITAPGKARVEGTLNWRPVAGDAIGRFELDSRVSNLDPSHLWLGARAARIDGTVKGSGGGAQQQFAVALRSDIYRLDTEGGLKEGVLSLARAELSAGKARVSASGNLALTAERKFAAQGRLQHFDPSAFVKTAPAGDLNLRFDLAGALSPTWQVAGNLAFTESRLAGLPVTGHAKMTVAPEYLRDADVDLDFLGNRLALQGGFGRAQDHLSFNVNAPALGRLSNSMGGSLTAQGRLSGTLANLVGDFSLRGERIRLPGPLSIQSVTAQGTLREGLAGQFDLHGEILGARGEGKEQEWIKHLRLAVAGTREKHDIELNAAGLYDESVALKARGGFNNMTTANAIVKSETQRWSGSLLALDLTGPFSGRLQAPTTLDLGAQRIALGEAVLLAQNGKAVLSQTEWRPDRIIAKGKISGVQVGFSLDEFDRTVFRGRSLQLGADWDVSLAEQPLGLIRVFREGGDLILQGDTPVAMGLENLDVNIAAQNGRLVLAALANGTNIGSLNAVLSANLLGSGSGTRLDMNAPLVGVANVALPSITWIGPFVSQNLRTEGRLQGEFHAVGTPANPVSTGRISGTGLGLGLVDEGMRLTDGRMALDFDAAQVRLESFSFRSDNRMPPPDSRLRQVAATTHSGSLTGSGLIQLPSGKGHFEFKADKLAALQRPDQWTWFSGETSMETGWDHIDLTAQMRADGGFIGVPKGGAPKLDDDVVVRGKRAPPPQRVSVNADINFDFGDRFLFKAYGIDAFLEGQMRLRLAQGQNPRATGSVSAVNGVYDAYGQKLSIDRGVVSFRGPLNDPGLNVVALRKGLSVEAGVEVTGTAQHPKVRLVSDPNVPESEKLSWILLGRASEAGSSDVGLILSAAGAALGGGSGEGIGARVAQGFGLDELSVGQGGSASRPLRSSVAGSAFASSSDSSSGSSQFGEQVVSLGKRLSARTYLGFEQNLLGTQSVVRLSYALTRYLSLIARAGTENALDLNYSISFR